MKNLGLMMIAVLATAALTQKSEAAQLSPADLTGQYRGSCVDSYGLSSEQVLFFQPFVNAKGETRDLPISTELFYSNAGGIPNKYAFLLKADQNALNTVAQFVRQGLSGTDNNLGIVATGPDFKHLYTAEVQGDSYVLTVSRVYPSNTGREFSNPPALDSCNYARSNEEGFKYESCFKRNDKTVFKVTQDGLTSLRTADAIGTPMNNYSFQVKAVATTCNWVKVN